MHWWRNWGPEKSSPGSRLHRATLPRPVAEWRQTHAPPHPNPALWSGNGFSSPVLISCCPSSVPVYEHIHLTNSGPQGSWTEGGDTKGAEGLRDSGSNSWHHRVPNDPTGSQLPSPFSIPFSKIGLGAFRGVPPPKASPDFSWYKTHLLVCVLSHPVMSDFLWLLCQAPLSMEFPRQEHWSGLPLSSPGNLPNLGIEPVPPALAGRFFTTCATWEALEDSSGWVSESRAVVSDSAAPWTILSVEFSRPEYWSG